MRSGVTSRKATLLLASLSRLLGIQVRKSSLAMNLDKSPRLAIRALISLAIILTTPSIASASWKEKVLYSFQGLPDGSVPTGGAVLDKHGNLYGATTDGGSSSCGGPFQCGTVYQVAPPAKKGDSWTETIVYVFLGKNHNDGETPAGNVIIDEAGNLYGTTAYGGTGTCILLGENVGCGTVYELSPPSEKGGAWTETVLYSFPTAKQGYLPRGNLVFDSAGNLYGATQFGGGYGTTCNSLYLYCGAVFELSPPTTEGGKWKEKVLHGFRGGTDGANPNGGFIFDSKGAIYGTTQFGGFEGGDCGAGGCGTVFKLAPPTSKSSAWSEELLDRFDPGNSGAGEPEAGVTFGKNGDLYGTTFGGGNSGSGTIFELAPGSNDKWKERVLYHFRDGDDGGHPQSSLVFDSKGNLFGTASGGGAVGNGTIFRLRPTGDSWAFATVYQFKLSPDGAYPTGSLIFDRAGNLYGITQYGGSGQMCGNFRCGTVFKVSP
jgi:uncharacterized repeat protein (TIGR03803 family)